MYAITIVDPKVLRDRDRLASAVNSAHEVLMRGDAAAIAQYVRNQDRDSLLATIAATRRLREQGVISPTGLRSSACGSDVVR